MATESDLRYSIIEAIKHYFSDQKYGHQISKNKIVSHAPENPAQTSDLGSFGRKPYDLAIFVPSTNVIFLEIKHLDANKKVNHWDTSQIEALHTAGKFNVQIPFAYNSWECSFANIKEDEDLLQEVHVRNAKDMKSVIQNPPMKPAVTLEEYLKESTSKKSSNRLVEVLDSNANFLSIFNSMPIMILANSSQKLPNQIFIDTKPGKLLNNMKELYHLNDNEREIWQNKNREKPFILEFGEAIFSMKDKYLDELASNNTSETNKPKFR
jgi:hypothetical protein